MRPAVVLLLIGFGLWMTDGRNQQSSRPSFEVDNAHSCFRFRQPNGSLSACWNYVSGSIHYFRVPHQYWEDRLMKAKAAGLSAIQTYIAWNEHEPYEGQFQFSQQQDVVAFLQTVHKLGMKVVLRPGPYICAEWDFGGLPAWLLTKSVEIRTADSEFLTYVDRYFSVLMPRLRPLLFSNGGPIIMIQVENEYGSYGCSLPYLGAIKVLIERHLKPTGELLFTTDGYPQRDFQCGSFLGFAGDPSVLATVDFGVGSSPMHNFLPLRQASRHSPLVNSEFYVGWLDSWGSPHAQVSTFEAAGNLLEMLSANVSVNMYMLGDCIFQDQGMDRVASRAFLNLMWSGLEIEWFHGGTNFGFSNGANMNGNRLIPQPTSYDYDAPLNEAGDLTLKYFVLRDVIENWSGHGVPIKVANTTKLHLGPIKLEKIGTLFELLPKITVGQPIKSAQPLSMEFYNQSNGLILYRSTVTFNATNSVRLLIDLSKVRDRAHLFIDEELVKRIDAWNGTAGRQVLKIVVQPNSLSSGSFKFDLLVENMGRINFGADMAQFNRKGFYGQVLACEYPGNVSQQCENSRLLNNWTIHKLDFSKAVDLIPANRPLERPRRPSSHGRSTIRSGSSFAPTFYGTTIDLNELGDTFVDSSNWTKGVMFINKYNLGRYWPFVGPQRTLFLPAPFLRVGPNFFLMVELDWPAADFQVEFVTEPRWKLPYNP